MNNKNHLYSTKTMGDYSRYSWNNNIDYENITGDGCWRTHWGYYWIFNHNVNGLIPVKMIAKFLDQLVNQRNRAATCIQSLWRGFKVRKGMRNVTFSDHIEVRDENGAVPNDFHQEMKTFDGPNPQSLMFAEMVGSFFARKWCNEIQLLEQYGENFISDNQDAFSETFQKAMIQIITGGRWGMWKDQEAVDPERPNHLRLFSDCSKAFRKAMILIKLREIPSNYRSVIPTYEAKYINVN